MPCFGQRWRLTHKDRNLAGPALAWTSEAQSVLGTAVVSSPVLSPPASLFPPYLLLGVQSIKLPLAGLPSFLQLIVAEEEMQPSLKATLRMLLFPPPNSPAPFSPTTAFGPPKMGGAKACSGGGGMLRFGCSKSREGSIPNENDLGFVAISLQQAYVLTAAEP